MSDQPEQKLVVHETMANLERALEELQKNLEEMEYGKEKRVMYYKQVKSQIDDLLEDMIKETQTKKVLLFNSIEDLMKKRAMLHTELNLDMIPKTYNEIPLYKVQQVLQADLLSLECIKKDRIAILNKLLAEELEICVYLGTKQQNNSRNVPTEQELENFKLYLHRQKAEKIRLENIFVDLRHSTIKMMDDLDVSPRSSFEQLIYYNPEKFVFNTNNMTNLKELKDELQTQMEERKCRIDQMRQDLLALWKYLDEPSDTCQVFLDKHPDYNIGTINALSAKINHCKEKRKEDISKYVTEIRIELTNLWDLCKYCDEEKNAFAPFYSNTFTEELMVSHELEVERLRKFYKESQAIFNLLDKRENFLTKIKELFRRANNSDRYNNRGGQLLIEEKERKTIQKKLPIIEAKIKEMIEDYNSSHKEIFTIYGTSFENVLEESWNAIILEKEMIKKEKEIEEKKKKLAKVTKKTSNRLTHSTI